ncbi:O-methyltransferase [Mycena epipterygia]|nr:O-methyltransferase [Mycena epipterygia]
MESLSTLRLLANIITDGVKTMERVYMESTIPLPSLEGTFDRNDPAELLRQHPEVSLAIKNIIAAAGQITAAVSEPVRMVVNTTYSFHVPCCLRVASEINAVEILREAGPQGAHVEDIAAPSRTNPDLIARILRLLATHHIFQELSPGVFANNRISSALDKGKASSLCQNRSERLTGTSGTAALVEFCADLPMKASAFLADSILHSDAQKLPFNLAFGTDDSAWEFLNRPENAYQLNLFGVTMRGTADPPESILHGFDWGGLPSGAVVIDVGGGMGQVALAISLKYPKLHMIIQDLEPTIELSKAYWREHVTADEHNESVEFQAHDFFTPQAVNNAAVFLIRHIIHDWADPQAISILKHLRRAATPTTQLLLVEKIVPPVSGDQMSHEVPGAVRPMASAPLLPNWGVASAEIYTNDLMMHNSLGGAERTVNQFMDILAKSGWNLVQIRHSPKSMLSHLVAVPS